MNSRPQLRLIKGGAPDPLWEDLKSLGGNKSDTYAKILVSHEWSDLKAGEYVLVYEDVPGDVLWRLTNGKHAEPFDCRLEEFKIVWKGGKSL